jgi:hypothetical protein
VTGAPRGARTPGPASSRRPTLPSTPASGPFPRPAPGARPARRRLP